MAHIRLESPRGESPGTNDLFQLIDSTSGIDNKKGLFASFKKKAVKLSRRSIGKEFEHQVLAGPSYSAESEGHDENPTEDDGWNLESRDDWGGLEDGDLEDLSGGRREGVESKGKNGFPPLAPSEGGKSPARDTRRRFNPKLQFSGRKKQQERGKPKDFSLTHAISKSFDSEGGSVSGDKAIDQGTEDVLEIRDQHSFSTHVPSTEYAQLDIFSDGAPTVTQHDVTSDAPIQKCTTHESNVSGPGGESTASSNKRETKPSLQVPVPSNQINEIDSTSGIDEGTLSFKERLAFYKNRFEKNTVTEAPKKNALIRQTKSVEKETTPSPTGDKVSTIPFSFPQRIDHNTKETLVKANYPRDVSRQNDPSEMPYQIKLCQTQCSTASSYSIQERRKTFQQLPDANAADQNTTKEPRSRRLTIGDKTMSYVPIISFPGDRSNVARENIKESCAPQGTTSSTAPSSQSVEKPMTIAQRKTALLRIQESLKTSSPSKKEHVSFSSNISHRGSSTHPHAAPTSDIGGDRDSTPSHVKKPSSDIKGDFLTGLKTTKTSQAKSTDKRPMPTEEIGPVLKPTSEKTTAGVARLSIAERTKALMSNFKGIEMPMTEEEEVAPTTPREETREIRDQYLKQEGPKICRDQEIDPITEGRVSTSGGQVSLSNKHSHSSKDWDVKKERKSFGYKYGLITRPMGGNQSLKSGTAIISQASRPSFGADRKRPQVANSIEVSDSKLTLPTISHPAMPSVASVANRTKDFSSKADEPLHSASNQTVPKRKEAGAAVQKSDVQVDFAARLSFFNGSKKTSIEESDEEPSPTSTRIAAISSATNIVDIIKGGDHPLYVTVDGECTANECLSPSPTLVERKIVCDPTSQDSSLYFVEEGKSLPATFESTEDATAEKKYREVKSRFSKKALPWRQKNAADRYLERNKSHTTGASYSEPMETSSKAASVKLPPLGSFNGASPLSFTPKLTTQQQHQSPFGTPLDGYQY